jgi:hypothetical protein
MKFGDRPTKRKTTSFSCLLQAPKRALTEVSRVAEITIKVSGNAGSEVIRPKPRFRRASAKTGAAVSAIVAARERRGSRKSNSGVVKKRRAHH